MSDRDTPVSREHLASLVTRLQQRGERERAALAQLLHDELGGQLAAARMALSQAQHGCETHGDAALRATLGQIEQQVERAFDVERRVVEQLRPGLLDHFGLGVALQSLYEQGCRDAGVRLQANVAPGQPALDPDRAIALYRVGQFALVRMLGAAPRSVELTLDVAADLCTLDLGHDGADAGFDAAPEFAGLTQWLLGLQGGLQVRSAAPPGRALRATLPLKDR